MCLGLFEEDVAVCIKSTLQWIKKGIKNPNPSNLPCDPVLRCFELSCAAHNPRFCSPLCPTFLFGYVDPSSNLIFNVKYYTIDSWFKENLEKIGEVAENQQLTRLNWGPQTYLPLCLECAVLVTAWCGEHGCTRHEVFTVFLNGLELYPCYGLWPPNPYIEALTPK